MKEEKTKLIANNKKARFDYFILDTYEAGIELHGTEVKSIRLGHVSIKEAFIQVKDNEVFIYNMHVNPYEKGNIFNKDPLRVKKLLLHSGEIRKLAQEVARNGYTIVPLTVYLSHGLVKLEIGLAKGKKLYDKRESIAEKDRKRSEERDARKGE